MRDEERYGYGRGRDWDDERNERNPRGRDDFGDEDRFGGDLRNRPLTGPGYGQHFGGGQRGTFGYGGRDPERDEGRWEGRGYGGGLGRSYGVGRRDDRGGMWGGTYERDRSMPGRYGNDFQYGRDYNDRMIGGDEGGERHMGLLDRAGRWLDRKLGKGPKGYTRSDERIREDCAEHIMHSGWIDASDVELVVKDAEVTLTGTVVDRRTKRAIEDLCDDVLGVHDVHNHIKVRREGETVTDRGNGERPLTTPTTTGKPRATT